MTDIDQPHFGDRLVRAIQAKGSPICVGIDPILSSFPPTLMEEPVDLSDNNSQDSLDAIYAFAIRVLQIVAPHVPCVKFQSAYFEKYLWDGVEAYYSLIHEASALGLVVIGDVKRGDIGSTASAYAAAHLASNFLDERDDVALPDAITVNPMLGMDTLEPFVGAARELGKGLFVLVRTSNPGSGALQDVPLADGRTWSEMLADHVSAIADTLTGERGYSSIGAVVGATQSQTMQSLRRRLPRSIFLLPGYGAQGATAEMTRAAFIDGAGAIVSASRSILYAHREPKYSQQFGNNWEQCVEQAVLDMKADLARVLQG